MMNLRHLKLWKRHTAGGTSGSGNDVTNDVVVRAAPIVDYDFRSPSSDSGYSDVVPASMSITASTTASFGLRHHHHQQHQQPPTQRRTAQLPPPTSNALHSPLELPVGTAGIVARSNTSIGASQQTHGKRSSSDAPLGAAMYRIAETSTTTTMTQGNTDGRKNPLSGRPTAARLPGTAKVATPGSGKANETVTMETFIGLIKRKDIEKLKHVLNETKFDVNTRDSVGRTLLHHAVFCLIAERSNDTAILKILIHRGADINIKDETNARETALHIALRLRHLAAIELLLESPGCDVIKCGSLQRHRMLPEMCLLDDLYQPPVPHLCRSSAAPPPSSSTSNLRQARANRDQLMLDDVDETLIKRRGYGDQFVISCRQSNTLRRLVELDLIPDNETAAGERIPVGDLVIIRDDRLPVLGDVLRRLEPETLARMYIVGCRVRIDTDCRLQLDRYMALRSLVLSNAHLRRIPDCVYEMTGLEVLKVDNNSLMNISPAIGRLEHLCTFICDSQRPRLRRLPTTISRLHQLQVLSFSDNRIESIDFVVSLPNLRVLRCDRNCVRRLPVHLVNLSHVTWIDISYNPIDRIPYQLLELLTGSKLTRFDYFGLHRLRPVFVRRHLADLVTHLRLEVALRNMAVGDSTGGNITEEMACDMTVAIYGETGCGKTTLMRALKDQRGVCRDTSTAKPGKCRIKQQVEVDRFAMDVGELLNPSAVAAGSPSRRTKYSSTDSTNGGDPSRTNEATSPRTSRRCEVTTISFSGDFIDAYTRQLWPDIRLLLVDMTSLEPSPGNSSTNHHYNNQPARHVTRTRMWLEALHELEPDAPVIIVGTHADLVRSTSGFDAFLDELFSPTVRRQHCRRYGSAGSPGYCPSCLLCAGGVDSSNRKSARSTTTGTTHAPLFKSRSSPVGRFDELSIHQITDDDLDVYPNGHVTSPEEMTATAGVASSSPLQPPRSRDHRKFSSGVVAETASFSSSTFPHVVGWAVVDSIRNFPKSESKKSNVSVERLRGLIGRLALGSSSVSAASCRVPCRWSSLARHIDSLGVDCGLASTPCLPLDDVICMARSYDVEPTEVPVLLHWLHRRGRLVFFAEQRHTQRHDDDVTPSSPTSQFLSRFVVTDAAWFAHQLSKMATEVVLNYGARQIDGFRLARSVLGFDQYLGSGMEHHNAIGGKAASTVSGWLLAAAERLDVCVPLGNVLSLSNVVGGVSPYPASVHFLPDLLEKGSPNRDAWPDRPETDERQVTCDVVGLRLSGGNQDFTSGAIDSSDSGGNFRSFNSLLVALCSSLDRFRRRPALDVVCDPAPVILATEVVFYTSLDVDGCPDCQPLRNWCRRRRMRGNGGAKTDDDEDDPDSFDFDCDGLGDDVLHKVRLTLDPDIDGHRQTSDATSTVRIQVRGPSPCCVIRAVIEFVTLYLDDRRQPSGTITDDNSIDDEVRFRSPTSNGYNAVVETTSSSEKNSACISTTIGNISDVDQQTVVSSMAAAMIGDSPACCLDGGSVVDMLTEVDSSAAIRNNDEEQCDDERDVDLDDDDDPDSGRTNFLLCPKCVLLGEYQPERVPYRLTRAALDRPRRHGGNGGGQRSVGQSRGRQVGRRCIRAVCSRWHNLGSWRRALTGDYRYGGSACGPGGSVGGGLGGIERPVYSLAPMTLPDYEHPRLLLLLPPSAQVSEVAWRSTARARFLEGYDLHVLCESPSAWHMIDGLGLRLPSQLPNNPAKRGEFSMRMLTVLDLSLAVIQLVQGANEHSQTGRLLAPVIVELLRTYEHLRAGAVISSIPHHQAPSAAGGGSCELPVRTEMERRRDAELYLAANRDRIVTVLTRTLTSAAQHSAAADSAQQADLYLKAGGSLGPDDVFGRGGGCGSTTMRGSSRTELGRFLRLETSAGRFGALRPIYVGGELRWVCERHYVELRSMPSIQLHM